MFRAKCRWIENGERPTKYFFNLEKSNYNKKTISELRLQEDSITRNETVIPEQTENYYSNLYTSDLTFLTSRTCSMPRQDFFVPYLLPSHVKYYPNSQNFPPF